MPIVGQTHCTENVNYQWNGSSWVAIQSMVCPGSFPFPNGSIEPPPPTQTGDRSHIFFKPNVRADYFLDGLFLGNFQNQSIDQLANTAHEIELKAEGFHSFGQTILWPSANTEITKIVNLEPTSQTTLPDMYEITLFTNANLDFIFPNWFVNKLRSVMKVAGYGLNNIWVSNGVIKMQVEKLGSVTITVLMGIVTVLFALLLIGIISYTVVKLSNNETTQAVSEDIRASLDKTLDYCAAAGLTPEECQEIVDAVAATYENVPTGNGNGFGLGDLFSNLPLIIGGILVITLIGSMKR